jgi:hypothetical protein
MKNLNNEEIKGEEEEKDFHRSAWQDEWIVLIPPQQEQ